MELKFLTPTEVWEGFDPSAAPLESAIISQEQNDHLVCSRQFFTSETTQAGRLRTYIEIFYDNRWADARATILILPQLGRLSRNAVNALVREGYVVAVLDYSGTAYDDAKRTTFPSDLAYAAYPACKDKLDALDDSARHSPWFVWAKMARRAISLLEELPIVSNDRIGIIGFDIGAHIAWQVAAMDKRVKALVPINGGGYRWARKRPRFVEGNVPVTDEEKAFSAGVGAETYAKFVTCPTLYICSRIGEHNDVDRAGDILNFVKSQNKHLIITRCMEKQLTRGAFDTMLGWLRQYFAHDGEEMENPSVEFEAVEGKLYLKLNTARKAKQTQVYVCYDEPYSYARKWVPLKNAQKTGVHQYIMPVPVYDPDELIVAYVTFKYGEKEALSAPVQAVYPAKLGVTATDEQKVSSRVMYDGSMGTGTFIAITRDPLLEEDNLKTAQGPFEIDGITTEEGSVALCLSTREVAALTRMSTLHIDAYSPKQRNLDVCVYTYPDMKCFTAHTALKGGEFWQKILLDNTDFKSKEGKTLSGFDATKVLALIDVSGAVFTNFLWI